MNVTRLRPRLWWVLVLCGLVAGCAATPTKVEGTGPTGYIDDSTLTTKVKTALLSDQSIKGSAIKVETFNGVVQLSGLVRDRREQKRIIQIAESVTGVKSVQTNLIIK